LFCLISPEAGLLTKAKKERWPDRKAGRVYGVNDGLAFAMCGALQKRKNRQSGWKLFSVLIFWLLLDQAKSN
jgi:hypothetical protein